MKKVLFFIWGFFATIFMYTIGITGSFICWFFAMFSTFFGLMGVTFVIQRIWVGVMFWPIFKRIHITGKENIQKDKAYLLVSNHGSLLDVPALGLLLDKVPFWVAKKDLFKIPFLGGVLNHIAIPIDRKSLRNTKHAIDNKVTDEKKLNSRIIIVFPEGTRTKTGEIQDLKRGFVYIMKSREIDVLPVTLNGFYKLRSAKAGRFWVNPEPKLEIIVHEPIPFEKLKDLPDSEIMSIVKNKIESSYKV